MDLVLSLLLGENGQMKQHFSTVIKTNVLKRIWLTAHTIS